MNIVVVDDEPIILNGELSVIQQCEPEASVIGFADAEEALKHVRECPVDVVFLDVKMPGKSGVDVAREIKRLRPATNIVFATAYNTFFQEAMRLHASGYILKPMRVENVKSELSDLRYPVTTHDKGLFVRAFGDFEVFYDNRPVWFKYQKTKELLAYLIDRNGSVVESTDLITVLWEGELGKSNYYKQLRKDLKATLERIGCENIVVKRRGSIGVLPELISCDFYDWLKGLPSGLNAYRGEYMKQYSWAEPTRASLERRGQIWTR